MTTYPGTDLLIRICYGCGKEVTEISDLWVDVDDNACVCTECRNDVRADYDTEEQWLLSITPAAGWDSDTINELEEG